MRDCYPHYRALRREMEGWAGQTAQLDPPGPHGGGEDEANYALAFFHHYLVTGSAAARARFDELFQGLAEWVRRECHHGYEAEAEAHHGIEPFLLFLPRYAALFPHADSARLLDDAAEHIGNWAPESPPWYDYERDRFYGYFLGTRTVKRDRASAAELAEHFRFIHVALAAHRATGKARYAEWALRYGRSRARRILEAPAGPLPLYWGPDGEPVYGETADADLKGQLSARLHHARGDPLAGVENLLASGAVPAFADLFRLAPEEPFRLAALRIVEPLVDELADPYADPAAAALAAFRLGFNDGSLDERIRACAERFPTPEEVGLALVAPERRERTWPGVGKRRDMLFWGWWRPDGSLAPFREPSPAALALAFQVTGRVPFAERALALAARKLMVARRVLRGGREHADMGSSVAAVAAGHGRNWGTGAVTGCYGPLVLGVREHLGALQTVLDVRGESGSPGLSEEVLALVLPAGPGRPANTVRFFNGGKQASVFEWKSPAGTWTRELLQPGVETTRELPAVGL